LTEREPGTGRRRSQTLMDGKRKKSDRFAPSQLVAREKPAGGGDAREIRVPEQSQVERS